MGIIGKKWKTRRSFTVAWGDNHMYVTSCVFGYLARRGCRLTGDELRNITEQTTTYYYLGTDKDELVINQALNEMEREPVRLRLA